MRLAKALSIQAAASLLAWLAASGSVAAGTVRVAVAGNFAGAFQDIASAFAADTGHKAVTSTGSTGKFNAQIRAGAPFDVLLAADRETPRRLEADGFAVAAQRFSYARGRLVLWSKRPASADAGEAALRGGRFERLAVANVVSAPYGAAAMQALTALGLAAALKPKLVQGESVAQAYQFVASGNAELGLVAWSQVQRPGQARQGSWWLVPAHLHAPLLQDAALLKPGEHQSAARALMAYLRGSRARAIIQAYGYELP